MGRFVFLFLFISVSGWADGNPSEFNVDQGVLDRIFQESVIDAKVDIDSTAAFEVRPLFSLLSPTELTLRNKYFEVPYAPGLSGLPSVSVGISAPMRNYGNLGIWAEVRAGYAQKETVTSPRAIGGLAIQDVVRMHLVPLSAALRADYRLVDWLTPSLAVGGGAMWIYQSGNLDGIEQGFWIPTLHVSPSLKLFEGRTAGEWFGGLNVGVTYLLGVATEQRLRALSFDVGATLRL